MPNDDLIDVSLVEKEDGVEIVVSDKKLLIKLSENKIDAKNVYDLFKGQYSKKYSFNSLKCEEATLTPKQLLLNEIIDVISEVVKGINLVIDEYINSEHNSENN